MSSMPAATPFIIPVFIAHQGCPHQCVFCNQHAISGRGEGEAAGCSPEKVAAIISGSLPWKRNDDQRLTQVAFYGGTFTALPADYQERLLAAVQPFLAAGLVHEVRLSTRPDAIDQQRIDLLQRYGVRIVELGAQSMDDGVLLASGRGHTVQHTVEAAALLKKNDLALGIQLMLGLPGDSSKKMLGGAGRVRDLRPDFVRLYPTLVIRGTKLAALYEAGQYKPLSLPQAVALTRRLKEFFDGHGIRVVRMGLQHEAALADDLLAGPYHPAFGELVLARIFYRQIRARLFGAQGGGEKVLTMSARDQSIFRGPGNCSMRRLQRMGLLREVTVCFDENLPRNALVLTPAL